MATVIPKTSQALATLLRADLTTQWRNRRAVILTLILPVIILLTWKVYVPSYGGPFVLSNSITMGLVAAGLMGYSNAIARDRDKGIFQRLRVAPLPSWGIMGSRLLVQLILMLGITTLVFISGSYNDHITLTPLAYLLTYLIAILSGAVYLSLGQMIVGLITNPETVNSTTRLAYLIFVMGGMFGELGQKSDWGKTLHKLELWSPYGTVKTILAGGMEPNKWDMTTTNALLLTIVYTVVFAAIGIKQFKWSSK